MRFNESNIPEWEFFAALPSLSGCGLLFDVNNVFVSCFNHGYQTSDYLGSVDKDDVLQIHLAGYTEKQLEQGVILIDDHSKQVSDEVWNLYQDTLKIIGNKPTLIEWDTNVPDLSILLSEAGKAQVILNG